MTIVEFPSSMPEAATRRTAAQRRAAEQLHDRQVAASGMARRVRGHLSPLARNATTPPWSKRLLARDLEDLARQLRLIATAQEKHLAALDSAMGYSRGE